MPPVEPQAGRRNAFDARPSNRSACRPPAGRRFARSGHLRYAMMRRSLSVIVAAIGRKTMFIAMNRFRVQKGSEEAFEKVWLTRETHLDRVPGFVEFHLLKGPQAEDHTLYASHTIWQSKSAFEAWTRSEEFRAAHARAGNETTGPLYLEHPKFEGFEVRQTVERKTPVA
jgi:heme-degrading monooxygenase HmoA